MAKIKVNQGMCFAVQKYTERKLSIREICLLTGVSHSTIMRIKSSNFDYTTYKKNTYALTHIDQEAEPTVEVIEWEQENATTDPEVVTRLENSLSVMLAAHRDLVERVEALNAIQSTGNRHLQAIIKLLEGLNQAKGSWWNK